MRLFLLLCFRAFMLLEAYSFTDETDRQALLAFKSLVSQGKRDVLSSWNHSFPLCNWKGVTCGRKHKRVTDLDLGGLQLGGVISPSIGNLSFLISLNLSDNSLGGTIPQEVGNLFRLEYLDMNSNILEGGIPARLSNCSRLLVLNTAINPLGGAVPSELWSLTNLLGLYLGENNLNGKLHASIGNLTSLTILDFGVNNMEGEIPDDIARLTQMMGLSLDINKFSGVFPPPIYNLSSLEYLSIFGNHFSGCLRPDFGKLLPNLFLLNLGSNYFRGVIPTTLANISTLQKLEIDDNNLTGSIPLGLGKLRNLQWLSLFSNSLGSYSFGDLDFLVALTNCTKLEKLEISDNRLGGDLPTFITNLSTNLYSLDIGTNFIFGSIPRDIGNLISLQSLVLRENMLRGALPTSLSKLFRLEGINLNSNKMSGQIPSFIGNLTRLDRLFLFNNSFEGTIPLSLSNCTSLRQLWIASNKLNGTIPGEIMHIQTLVFLDMSDNSLRGSLPEDVGRLEALVYLSVAYNKLSGHLPHSLGNCLSMEILLLQGNYFDGAIPDVKGLKGVKRVDFSNNNLSGSIPAYLAIFSSLEYINLSINNLEGNVPTEGKFQNATIVLVFGNKNLCGGIKELKLKPCLRGAPPMGSKHSSRLKRVVIGVSIGMALLLLLLVALVSLRWFGKRKRNHQTNNPTPSALDVFHEKISYGEIRNATDGFSPSNKIGSGSFGTVFKALHPIDNKVVAVKVLNMQRRGAMRSFLAECESLKDIRHRNLVKLLTACSSIDFEGNEFRALIYEFMPNGSLDMWLHPEEVEEIRRPSRNLTLLERLNVAIDVASVLDYLHVHCHEPIAHCDLKPSNILLDDDLTAHVSDFGLARLLLKFDQEFFLNQLSSTGVSYHSPEKYDNWTGITCGRKHKRVIGLDLKGLQLSGVISPSIGNLSFLISLNLSHNSFRGTIPQEVGNLFRLKHLDMSFNLLGGGIQVSLSNCSRLVVLIFDSNHLGGSVPSELGSLRKLVSLYLGGNNLKGKLPASLGNLTSLRELHLGFNNIEGRIPDDIARLNQMLVLDLAVNNFSGVFPPPIYNLSSLKYLYISGNRFSAFLRSDFGKLLPNLVELNMGQNGFTGVIPTTLSNISTLQKLAINDNNLTGSIPLSFGKLRNLQWLFLFSNSLGSYSFGDLDFLVALANCTKLEKLEISDNRLGGDLPTFITNLSTNLYTLDLGKIFISGSIPRDIGNLISLQSLVLQENMLTGAFPTSLGKISRLEGINLDSNIMSGKIPSFIGNLTRLDKLYLFNNSFEGTIPLSLSNCTSLRELIIRSNKLHGTMPQDIMQIQSLLRLDISRNSLTGALPEDVGRLEYLVYLSVAYNKLSGHLPHSLGNCLSMETLLLQGNYFDGAIPEIKGLKGVKRVDFSNNNLSGSIPAYLAIFSSLEYINLSINNLEGSVPTEGKFQNATIVLVFGNKNLCGGIKELKLKPCLRGAPPMGSKHSSRLKRVVIGVSIGMALLLLLLVALVSLRWFGKRKKNHQTNNPTPSALDVFHEKISYGEIRNATDGFSSSNKIGSGSFGTVFKALHPIDNKVVVKVLNMQRRGAMRSFLAECESLKDIRHRNLVKLLTACSSMDFQGNEFRALIYEFMPNGSLDTWLHPEEVEEIRRPSRTLTLLERLNIAIDVSSVLDYLHVHCHEPIAHCDLKPSNILLDDDLTVQVSDFGLARLLLKFDQESFLNQLSSTGVRGTVGYAAPEYGMGGQPSIHGDVYSFGVLLLEMFTGKRPTNELFGENFILHSYTKSALPERVMDIADKSILHSGLRVGFPIAECLTLILDVGLRCCEESPTNRLATSEAAKELISIREKFFKARRTARR